MPTWLLILLTIVVTFCATLVIDFVVRQFARREKRVERKIEHLYAAGDEQFVRSMANLLTGPFREGNRITPLLNGAQVFPAMLNAIRAARRTITFETFIYWAGDTGHQFAHALAARRGGVEIEIIVPGQYNDEGLVRLVSRSRYGKLLRAGIKIYEYQPTMYHTKLMIVDDLWISVGSTNFDNRSFSLNDEINLNAIDRELARNQTEWFEHDKTRSHEIKLDEWARRPVHEKLREHAVSWLHSQL